MTCEDRQVVRRKCIRCFLIRESDLKRFVDWDWVRSHVRVERPWHWYRLVALHAIAWEREREATEFAAPQAAPLVDRQARHPRIPPIVLGVCGDEPMVGEPFEIPWESYEDELRKLDG